MPLLSPDLLEHLGNIADKLVADAIFFSAVQVINRFKEQKQPQPDDDEQ